jgi:hypothetical protein
LKEFDGGTMAFTGKHAPGCLRRNGKQVPLPSTSSNCSDQMHQWVEQRATHPDHLHDPADLIWRDCVAHFTEVIGPNFNGLDKSQIRNLVYHSREKTFGSNAIAKVESQYSGPSATAFLRCNTTFTDEKKMQRMMCFALPALLNLLMYPMVRIKAQLNGLNCGKSFTHSCINLLLRSICLLMPYSILYPIPSINASLSWCLMHASAFLYLWHGY